MMEAINMSIKDNYNQENYKNEQKECYEYKY